MRKNLRSKILLCILAGGVLAANTALADAPDRDVHKMGETVVYAYGESISNGSYTKDNGYLKSTAEGTGSVTAYALYASGSTINLGNVDLTAKAVGDGTKRVDAKALYVRDGSNVTVRGGTITATAENGSPNTVAAIYVLDSNVNIISNDITVNGDICNDVQTGISSNVIIDLSTKNAVINGNIQDYYGATVSIQMTLSDGATWNILGGHGNLVAELNLDNGVVNRYTNDTVRIGKYSGNGNINFDAENTDIDGVLDFSNTGRIYIDNADTNSIVNLGVINNSVNTLDVEKTKENLNAVAENIVYKANDDNLSGKVIIKEGLITPEARGNLAFDKNNVGYVNTISGGNSTTQTMDAMQHLAETAIVAWRQEDSTLSQRLGELRESEGGQGVWVRVSRGEFEYDGAYKNQYNFFQMGYDWASGDWHYGAAVSHNDGQTTYTHGDGENRSTSLSLYGTWLGDKGHYADIVLKQGRLSNDFDIYTEAGHTSGDYDAWGTSLSGEYGMKVALNDGWYVTPQAQLTLMRIGGEDYTTNNGIKVNQDSLESAVGRVGFEVGKRISDSGSIYAKASLLHDFAGSADTYLSYKGLTNSYHQDIGDTWCEAGIGFNYKTSENSYVYADVVKTFGGDVETPWQWNAGMRWTF